MSFYFRRRYIEASILSVILVIFVLQDPPRGESEGAHMKATSYKEDVVYLFKKSVPQSNCLECLIINYQYVYVV